MCPNRNIIIFIVIINQKTPCVYFVQTVFCACPDVIAS
jgi:hypothetical protein